MNFTKALAYIKAGKRVTRELWNNPENNCFLDKDGFLSIHTDKDHQWIIHDEDLVAEDWQVVVSEVLQDDET